MPTVICRSSAAEREMNPTLETERLLLRPWRDTDADDALGIYGDEEVTRWLTPAMAWVPDVQTMRDVLRRWQTEDVVPASHWAVERRDTGQIVGGAALVHLAPWKDLEIAWHLGRRSWGHGYATEAGNALTRWAMHRGGVDEVFALIGPDNTRAAATAQRIGMEWLGETDDYHHRRLELYRVRHQDLTYFDYDTEVTEQENR
ncbi:GNAT family N-acetyltransferase [Kribbella ginsengisoli]|uniref:GNAT family N-acetyltransferase n=2 Tax=Kribbella ginsengisoli TaxID=363865 RepID=A0ABP6VUG2_9ACTN